MPGAVSGLSIKSDFHRGMVIRSNGRSATDVERTSRAHGDRRAGPYVPPFPGPKPSASRGSHDCSPRTHGRCHQPATSRRVTSGAGPPNLAVRDRTADTHEEIPSSDPFRGREHDGSVRPKVSIPPTRRIPARSGPSQGPMECPLSCCKIPLADLRKFGDFSGTHRRRHSTTGAPSRRD